MQQARPSLAHQRLLHLRLLLPHRRLPYLWCQPRPLLLPLQARGQALAASLARWLPKVPILVTSCQLLTSRKANLKPNRRANQPDRLVKNIHRKR
jgi:hypothetical protein